MINIPKRQSFRTIPPSAAASVFPYPALSVFFVCILYLVLPALLAARWHLFKPLQLAFFYAAVALCAAVVVNRAFSAYYKVLHELQDIHEKINIIRNDTESAGVTHAALSAKIVRYTTLETIIEKVSASLDLDYIACTLADVTYSLFADNQGTCLLYLVDPSSQRLRLFKSKKHDAHLVVKAKEGDIFDQWVVKHANPLLVANIKVEYRFDPEKISLDESRPILSLVSAPFIVENRFLGLLRLDSPEPNSYTQDDLRLLVTISDVGAVALENGELYAKTQELAIHDGLTGLLTKGFFLERLAEEIKRSHRAKTHFSLLMLDIDHFKNYNDTFGHIAGDVVLRKLSANVMDCLKTCDPIVSRFGGEELCIILPHADKRQAHTSAEDLRARIASSPVNLRKQVTSITVSIGVAAFPDDGHNDDELIRQADRAMYEAKNNGRNRVIDAE